MNPAYLFEIYPIRELMLFACLTALVRVSQSALSEAKITPQSPVGTPKMKLKQGEKRRLTGPEKGSTVKLLGTESLLGMFPPERIEEIKKKELRRYKETQDQKWRSWLEAVSK